MTRRELLSALVIPFVPSRSQVGTDRANLTSMIRLIANPREFDGQRVRLAGYVELNGIDESVGLYLSESDGKHFIISNSISLDRSAREMRKYMGKYVLLNARYHAPTLLGNGHLDGVDELRMAGEPE